MQYIDLFKALRSVETRDTFSALAPVLGLSPKILAMSPSSTVHGGQHMRPNIHVTFELLLHAAFIYGRQNLGVYAFMYANLYQVLFKCLHIYTQNNRGPFFFSMFCRTTNAIFFIPFNIYSPFLLSLPPIVVTTQIRDLI